MLKRARGFLGPDVEEALSVVDRHEEVGKHLHTVHPPSDHSSMPHTFKRLQTIHQCHTRSNAVSIQGLSTIPSGNSDQCLSITPPGTSLPSTNTRKKAAQPCLYPCGGVHAREARTRGGTYHGDDGQLGLSLKWRVGAYVLP
jgi:hypothetical protein